MTFYPDLSEEVLLRQLVELHTSLQTEGVKWPAWMTTHPADVLKEKKFIVCGAQCRPEIRVLAKHANVVAIVDDVVTGRGGERLFGVDVIDSDAWIELARGDDSIVSIVLVSGPTGYQHFVKLAAQWGLQLLKPLQFLHLLSACGISRNGEIGRFFWYGEEFFDRTLDRFDKLVEARNRLDDPWSRITWLCVLLYRLTLNPFFLVACATGYNTDRFSWNSYETNRRFFQFSDSEVYVDGGASTGDSLAWFLRAVDGRFKHIHTFEPSSENNRLIRKLLSDLQASYLASLHSKVSLHEKGLWDSETTLLFNPCTAEAQMDSVRLNLIGNPTSAHIIAAGIADHLLDEQQQSAMSVRVPVTAIDTATDRDATFIKLEIEGSELNALHGASETIARNRPKMAISMYHKPEDLETLLDFVLETGHGYRLGFRQHNPFCPDAMVMYCR